MLNFSLMILGPIQNKKIANFIFLPVFYTFASIQTKLPKNH